MNPQPDIGGYKAIIFDLDGTLVDNMGVHLHTWIELLRELGVTMTAHEFHERYAGQTNPVIFRGIFGERLSDERIMELAEHKETLYRRRYADQLKPVAGLPALMDALESAGIPRAVGSSGSRVNVHFVLDGLGWRARFGAIITGEDVTHCKPAPEVFLTAARRLGVAPADCLVFEDAPIGIEAARRAGMDAVALTTTLPRASFERLSPPVIGIVDDFADVRL